MIEHYKRFCYTLGQLATLIGNGHENDSVTTQSLAKLKESWDAMDKDERLAAVNLFKTTEISDHEEISTILELEPNPGDKYQRALNIKFHCGDLNERLSIRDYLLTLLKTLWRECDGFSGKRPFGNSGWQFDVYRALVQHGFIKGKIDEDGLSDLDNKAADRFILKMIDYLEVKP